MIRRVTIKFDFLGKCAFMPCACTCVFVCVNALYVRLCVHECVFACVSSTQFNFEHSCFRRASIL